jgi:outer membrane protein assembly factor BamB
MKTICLITLFAVLSLTITYSQTESLEKKCSEEAIAWKFKTKKAVYASPVIESGVIYIGSLDGYFYAIEAKSGIEKWKYNCTNKILSSALVHQKQVYFTSDNKLISLDLNGKLVWEVVLSNDSIINRIDPWDFHHSSPIVQDNVIYVGCEKGLVLGVDAKNGMEVFKVQTENQQTIRTTPVIYHEKLLFGDWDGVMHAYDLETSEKLWQYDTKVDNTYGWKNSIHGQPQIFNNSVIFSGRSSRLYSVDIEAGKRNWVYKSPTDQWLVGGPVISESIIYLGSSDQHLFRAFDANKGTLKWETKLDCRIWGRACILDDKIYIGSNSLYVIDKKTGSILKQYTFAKVHEDKKYGKYIDRTANIHSSPIIFEDKVIFGSDDGSVYALKCK